MLYRNETSPILDRLPCTSDSGTLPPFPRISSRGGRWEHFLKNCPLHYTGDRGSGALNVMGSVLLSVLCGHWRYVHINAVRGDGINPGLLGMKKTTTMNLKINGAGLGSRPANLLPAGSGLILLPCFITGGVSIFAFMIQNSIVKQSALVPC